MKLAYFGIPHMGGTYTVYKSLADGLLPHGIDVHWVGVGPSAQAAFDDPKWSAERDRGVALATQTDDEQQQAAALREHLEAHQYDGVFVNVLAGRVPTNVVRYLDARILRILIVHNITPGTYAAARAVRDHVHATIGVSPRIQADLVRAYGFDAQRTWAIPNAIDLLAFQSAQHSTAPGSPLRLLFLGRVVNADKGVFWLPKIMDRLPPASCTLSIVGDGPDGSALKQRCAHLGERVRFLGRVAPAEVPAVLANHDVFLFPSRFEGLGLSLVEAMAAGCVPVASRIRQVTDFVVNDGENGLLFPVGDVAGAAAAIQRLAEDRGLLARLSAAARQNAAHRFDLPGMARAYAAVLNPIAANPPLIAPAKAMADWSYPRGLKPGLRTYLPNGLKNLLRVWRERLAV